MGKIIAIIQARTGSSRLYGKVLFNLEGKAVLERIVERVRRSRLIEETIVATTILKEDLKIVYLCSAKGIRVYAGSKNDVLDRYFQAARLLGAGHIVRVTADNPLIDYQIIDQAIKLHLSKGADYTTNTLEETFPDGEDVEILTFEALKRAWKAATMLSEREHVTPYIRKHTQEFKIINFTFPNDLSAKRWTLDQKEDYEFIKLVYKALGRKNKYFGMADILEFLKQNPQYERINAHIGRNEGYKKSLREDRACQNMDYICKK